MSSDDVAKAKELGAELRSLREQEIARRIRRNEILEEWAQLYKRLNGFALRDATQAYWDAQTGEEMLYVRRSHAS